MKHTPGPWVHKRDDLLNDYDNPGTHWNARNIWSPGYSTIAHVIMQHNDDGESEANARLIEAAPDLLEACQMLLTLSLPRDVSGRAMVDRARAAIEKATS